MLPCVPGELDVIERHRLRRSHFVHFFDLRCRFRQSGQWRRPAFRRLESQKETPNAGPEPAAGGGGDAQNSTFFAASPPLASAAPPA